MRKFRYRYNNSIQNYSYLFCFSSVKFYRAFERFCKEHKHVLKTSLIFLLFTTLTVRCENPLQSESIISKENLCYVKSINNNWEIVINNGHYVKNISNNILEDNDPACSPNGRYVAYTHLNSTYGSEIFLFDSQKDTSYSITQKLDYSARSPSWLNDSTVVYQYHKIGENVKTFITDINGSFNRQILDFSARMFFCKNENDFYYSPTGTDEYKFIYKTNLNGTYNNIILDLQTVGKEYTGVYDYDPHREKLLLLIAQNPRATNTIAEYDIITKKIDTLSTTDTGYVYLYPKYSHNFSKIITLSRNYDSNISRIILLDKSNLSELLTLNSDREWLQINKYVFSPDNNKLVFSKYYLVEGEFYSWYSEIYVYNLLTKISTYIDQGINPIWITKQ